ncbi:MAG: DUF86 domain-containing protein [Rhodocyclaceae bacterium]|nr:DUF86 domain-containing protein [Rhodocyclaceae bacterium]
MVRDPRTYLEDVRQAADAIASFVADKTLPDYQADLMLRSAVERQFEIIGEAVNQLTRCNPELAARIPEGRRIVDFRNVLAHGYAVIDDAVVWQAVQQNLPSLRRSVESLLTSLP